MLAKMFKMMKKGNKGFTLVELMVVVVIIGVLTAIAVPVYNNVTGKANRNAIAANLRIIDGAISQYKTDKGTAPTATNLEPDYIQVWPANPKGAVYSVVAEAGGVPTHASVAITDVNGITTNGSYTLSQILELDEKGDKPAVPGT